MLQKNGEIKSRNPDELLEVLSLVNRFIKFSSTSELSSGEIEKKLKRFLISLSVGSDGKIKGSAAGRNVTGNWDWIDEFFCRTLLWGKRELKYNQNAFVHHWH